MRELRKALGFLSLSVAHHHLKKLREMGLVLRDEGGGYLAQEKVDVGILKIFVLVVTGLSREWSSTRSS